VVRCRQKWLTLQGEAEAPGERRRWKRDPERLGPRRALNLTGGPLAKRNQMASRFFLLIVIPICPRIQIKGNRPRRRLLPSQRFVKPVLPQLGPRGGTGVAAKLFIPGSF